MPVYVDNLYQEYRGMTMCHMMADTQAELLEMADSIGLQHKWIQCPNTIREHFDVSLSKRQKAIELGAQPITKRELVSRMLQKAKSEDDLPSPKRT